MPDTRPNHDPEQEAYERGLRQAYVNAELESHAKQLAAINGSIERHARNAKTLELSIHDLRDKVEQLAAQLATRAAVEKDRNDQEKDRNDQLKRANDKQISTRMFWLGVAAIIATLIANHLLKGSIF